MEKLDLALISPYHALTGIGSSSGSPPAINSRPTPRLESQPDPNEYDMNPHIYDMRCRCKACSRYEIELNEEIRADIKRRGY